MRPASIFAWTVAPVVLLAMIAGLLFTSWNGNRFRGRIERAFEHATGHGLRIGGEIRLRLLPSPELLARDVSVSNLPGGTRPVMITAAAIDVVLEPFALLERRVDVTQLSLTRPDILLETVRGKPNWLPTTRTSPARQAGSRRRAGHPVMVRLDEASLRSGRLTWNAPDRLGTGTVLIDRLRVRREGHTITLSAAGRHGATSFTVSAGSARTGELAWNAPFPLRAELQLSLSGDEGHLVFDGSVTPAERAYDGRIEADLPHLALIDGLFPHASLPALTTLSLRADLAGRDRERPTIRTLTATATDIDLSRFLPALMLARATVNAERPDAPLLVDVSGEVRRTPVAVTGALGTLRSWQSPGRPGTVRATLSLGGDTLKLDGAAARRTANASLQAHVDLSAPDAEPVSSLLGSLAARVRSATGDLDVSGGHSTFHAALDAQTLSIGAASFSRARIVVSLGAAHMLSARASFAGQPPWLVASDDTRSGAVTLKMDGTRLPASPILSLLTGEPIQGGSLSVSATLRGTAHGQRLDRASLSGPLTVTVRNATLPSELTGALLAAIISNAHLPPVANAPLRLDCVAIDGSIDSDRLNLASFSAVSSLVDVDGHGTVDLTHDTLALAVKPTLHVGPTSIATAAAITGSFARPIVALAPAPGGRVGITIGGSSAPSGTCAGTRPKPPNTATLLRRLGILR